jgi:hypothetical protein
MNVNVLEDVIAHESSLDNVIGASLYLLSLSGATHVLANPFHSQTQQVHNTPHHIRGRKFVGRTELRIDKDASKDAMHWV